MSLIILEPEDLDPILQRIKALEDDPGTEPVDLGPLTERVKALEDEPDPEPVDLEPLVERISNLENRPSPSASPVDLGPLTDRIDKAEASIIELRDRPVVVAENPYTIVVKATNTAAVKAARDELLASKGAGTGPARKRLLFPPGVYDIRENDALMTPSGGNNDGFVGVDIQGSGRGTTTLRFTPSSTVKPEYTLPVT